MKHAIALLTYLFCLLLQVQAQEVQEKFNQKFINYLTATLPEKIYLQTDKPYYVVEDTIWLKAYVVNAQIHQPAPSNFVYVELINQQDEVLNRIKIKRDSTGFQGYIKPDKMILPGEYALRAYTNWMKNEPHEYFFQKNISIGRIVQIPRLLSVTFQRTKKNELKAKIKYTHNNGMPIAHNRIDFSYNKGDKKHNRKYCMTDKQGEVEIEIKPNEESDMGKQQLTATICDDKGGIIEIQNFIIPPLNQEYDMQFFPESGDLLADILQTIAFKTVRADGLSTFLTGEIVSGGGNVLAEFKTEHNGMGKFILTPQKDSTYYAIATDKEGIKRKFLLPEVKEQGVALQVARRESTCIYTFENKTSYPTDSLYLIGHTRGMLSVIRELSEQKKTERFELDEIPEGILNLAIVNRHGKIFCERLVFVKKKNRLAPEIVPDSTEYGKRSKVELELNTSYKGNFALSVTDTKVVKWDERDNNIVSQLLLTSELRGYIETPGYYFADNNDEIDTHLDLLMLTQGWRKYDISDILQAKIPDMTEPLERGQALTGLLKPTLLRKNLKGVGVVGFSKKSKKINAVNAIVDSTGRYTFRGLDFPDGTRFTINAVNRKGKAKGIVIHPDPEKYPLPKLFIPHTYDKSKNIKTELLKTYQESYKQHDIWREVVLDDINVTAKYITPTGSSVGFLMNDADYYITRQTIKEKYNEKSIADIIEECFTKRYPAIQRIEDDFYYGARKLIILINKMKPVEHYELRFYKASNICGIGFIRNGNRSFNNKIGDAKGILLIDIIGSKYAARNFNPSLGLATLYPLGYQKPVEFYSPKYDVPDSLQTTNTDFRTTVYWNPKIQTDSVGHVTVSFYTTDMEHDMEYVLEGITEKGIPCKTTGRIKAKKE